MNEAQEPRKTEGQEAFSREVEQKAQRKLKAQRHGPPQVWHGLGMMGLVGWSVAVPTLLGAALGLWLDRHYPGGRSWTLALLAAGLALGCWNAWRWVAKEAKAISENDDNGSDE
ncbi:MAG: AtpZ/AtpI family protein [Phaeodactylibacter sp.]|nr:AtpZ/AtpI family protein [Phaeodactylibacter sp.]MCB9276193.1 AtpZ/AtpI family protein [Lewinellaceae bacterium]